jgi:hypothetical protein
MESNEIKLSDGENNIYQFDNQSTLKKAELIFRS